MKDDNLKVVLPNHLRGRSLDTKVIPMLCHLKTTLNHLVELKGDASLLKQWEKRSYRAYCLGEIQDLIVESYPEDWPEIVKEHILSKDVFIDYVKSAGISTKDNTASAIWKVGKADGIYLGLLNGDGSIRDINFFRQWTKTEFVL